MDNFNTTLKITDVLISRINEDTLKYLNQMNNEMDDIYDKVSDYEKAVSNDKIHILNKKISDLEDKAYNTDKLLDDLIKNQNEILKRINNLSKDSIGIESHSGKKSIKNMTMKSTTDYNIKSEILTSFVKQDKQLERKLNINLENITVTASPEYDGRDYIMIYGDVTRNGHILWNDETVDFVDITAVCYSSAGNILAVEEEMLDGIDTREYDTFKILMDLPDMNEINEIKIYPKV